METEDQSQKEQEIIQEDHKIDSEGEGINFKAYHVLNNSRIMD